VPLNYRLAPATLAALTANHPHALLLADEDSSVAEAIDPDRWLDGLAIEAAATHEAPFDPELPAALLYTSGTTAAPKAAILRHRHLCSYVIGTVELGGAAPDDASLVAVPPYHVAGLANLLTNLYAGRRCIVLGSFEPGRWLATVRSEGATNALVVPTMLARLVDHLDGAPAATPTLRSLAYGGARTPAGVLERALAAFPGVDFVHAYGLTETSSTVAVLSPDDHRAAVATGDPAARARLGSVGRPIAGVEVEVRDADGSPLPPGAVGRICLRGEQISGEYVGAAAALDGDGWFDTRDRGHLDDAGYLFVEGRDDDTIIRGGENVAPAEIEDVLLDHPLVKDAVVVGLPDEEWGQRIAAAVTTSAPTDPAEIAVFARARLRSSKAPEHIEIWPDLPRTDTGKVVRRHVLARLDHLHHRVEPR
jgi:acyl-CoA synthetase (AMP-forming)/AMP-acid ligase II